MAIVAIDHFKREDVVGYVPLFLSKMLSKFLCLPGFRGNSKHQVLPLIQILGVLGGVMSPPTGVLGGKAPLNIKWIILEKFQSMINQQV